MTGPGEARRTVNLGAWLHRVNRTRAELAAKGADPMTARGCRDLRNLAVMDVQRRWLRRELAERLLGAGQ